MNLLEAARELEAHLAAVVVGWTPGRLVIDEERLRVWGGDLVAREAATWAIARGLGVTRDDAGRGADPPRGWVLSIRSLSGGQASGPARARSRVSGKEGIVRTEQWSVRQGGRTCGHRHRSAEAAVACARRLGWDRYAGITHDARHDGQMAVVERAE